MNLQALVQNSAVFADRLPALLTHRVISCNQQIIITEFYGSNWHLFPRNLTYEILSPLHIKCILAHASGSWTFSSFAFKTIPDLSLCFITSDMPCFAYWFLCASVTSWEISRFKILKRLSGKFCSTVLSSIHLISGVDWGKFCSKKKRWKKLL